MRAEYPTVNAARSDPIPEEATPAWLVALDTGGTFTDLVARGPDGALRRAKVPSDGSILATVVWVGEVAIADEVGGDRRADEVGGDRPADDVGAVGAAERANAAPRGDASLLRVRIAPAAGLALPEGLLAGWRVAAADGATVTVVAHRGDEVLLRGVDEARVADLHAGQPIRFVRVAAAADTGAAPTALIDAPRLGLHIITGTPLDEPLPPVELRLSTTRGTNALLEGRGARVGVLVSDGLEGVVEIGDQTREDLFARVPRRTRRVAHGVAALPERSLADGTVALAAGTDACLDAATRLATEGCDAIVVSLAHALANGRERELAATLRTHGVHAIAARDIAAHPRLLARTETACVHARIAPILEAFVADATRSAPRPSRAAADARAFVFTSAGVLQRAARLLARDTLYSGPAGGARAVCSVARRHAIARAVGFDMGGTSSDVSRTAEGEVALRAESRIDGMTVAAPSVAIDSVAAGGGSICRLRDGAFEVGPESAGANPGPACYGRGGPLTITDINLLAGRMATGEGAMSVDRTAAERALDAAARARGVTPDEAMLAFLDIANARMALAIEALCVRDGVDPRGHALIAFGGAGGQHACAIADRLGIDRIVFPRFAGFMCAQGVFDASPARFATVPVLQPLDACVDTLAGLRSEAIAQAESALAADGFARAVEIGVRVALRLAGQEASIEVDDGTIEELRARFAARFHELFGYTPPPRAVEVVSLTARAAAPAGDARRATTAGADRARDGGTTTTAVTSAPATSTASNASTTAPAARHAPILSEGARADAAVLARGALAPGATVAGPAIITDAGETVVLDRSWRARVDASGDLVAERREPAQPRASAAEQELFAARLESIALAMGHVLERTALSPNIRDRLDFSCAVLDANGTLVQNAPHLPVHLGALGVCARAVLRALPLDEGDIAVTNHPAFGGSHLPDVTTVAPVFVDGRRVAFVAVRAHHAEIGGTRPGSFPPDARALAEEGVVLPPFHAVRAGVFDHTGCRARFADAPYPSRNPDENLADLLSQIAATRHGVAQVAALARETGAAFALRCEGELDRAHTALRRALVGLGSAEDASPPSRAHDGHPAPASATPPLCAERRLDDGAPIRVRLARRADGGLVIDFTGSAPVHRANFNAPRAVTQAATLYALRLLIDEPVPMNEGLLRAVDLVLPEGMLNPPFTADPTACPPVVAGNVETSQSVVAVLLDALGLAAESQSTMNNVLFGDAGFGVYETLGGGAGAGPDGDGASAVHVHMSNTRLTDIDVLERRAPVVIRRFAVRRGSGAGGRHRGGDGLVRSYEFLRPVSLSFFGSRRVHAPKGMAGGGDGACGVQHAVLAGRATPLPNGVLSLELAAGDRFTVETPGGGGYGRA